MGHKSAWAHRPDLSASWKERDYILSLEGNRATNLYQAPDRSFRLDPILRVPIPEQRDGLAGLHVDGPHKKERQTRAGTPVNLPYGPTTPPWVTLLLVVAAGEQYSTCPSSRVDGAGSHHLDATSMASPSPYHGHATVRVE